MASVAKKTTRTLSPNKAAKLAKNVVARGLALRNKRGPTKIISSRVAKESATKNAAFGDAGGAALPMSSEEVADLRSQPNTFDEAEDIEVAPPPEVGVDQTVSDRVRPPPRTGDSPNTEKARAFTREAAILIVGKDWGEFDLFDPKAASADERKALHICMVIAAMFGKSDRRLSVSEQAVLTRLNGAVVVADKRDDAKALGVLEVREHKLRFQAAKTGGAKGQCVLELIGSLTRKCSPLFEKLRTREHQRKVTGFLGSGTSDARIFAQLSIDVDWLETARARDLESVTDATRKAYERFLRDAKP